MKVNSAVIKLVQKKNRQMKDGTYPVYIVVCFHGRIEKRTGVSCPLKYWDAKRECVKGTYPNYALLNSKLSKLKSRIVKKRDDFEYKGKKYTPALLLQDSDDDFDISENVFKVVMKKLITERRLKSGTVRGYDYTFKKLSEFLGRKDFIVDELVLGVVKDFATWLEKNGIKMNTIKRVLCCVAAVWNFAIERKILPGDDYPFRVFKYSQRYREVPRDYYLEKSHIIRIKDFFLDLVIERSGNRWHYREGAYDRLHNRNSLEFALCWLLMMYKMNGISPADFAFLKITDCQRIIINGEEYWKIETKRKKTGRDVHIRLKRDVLTIVGFEHFLGLTERYVYPILKYREGAEDKFYLEQSHRLSVAAVKKLREAFVKINEGIAQDNVENHANEPLIEPQRFTMYCVRHSFATQYLTTPGATVNGLASLLARSANTISTYVKQLTKDEEIADMVSLMPI